MLGIPSDGIRVPVLAHGIVVCGLAALTGCHLLAPYDETELAGDARTTADMPASIVLLSDDFSDTQHGTGWTFESIPPGKNYAIQSDERLELWTPNPAPPYNDTVHIATRGRRALVKLPNAGERLMITARFRWEEAGAASPLVERSLSFGLATQPAVGVRVFQTAGGTLTAGFGTTTASIQPSAWYRVEISVSQRVHARILRGIKVVLDAEVSSTIDVSQLRVVEIEVRTKNLDGARVSASVDDILVVQTPRPQP